jgi:CRISPR-associated protein Csd1
LLLESLSDSSKEKKEGIPAAIGAQFYRASIDQRIDFPQTAFFRAIFRYRAELPKESDEKKGWKTKDYNDARAAIIKAYLNRKNRKMSGREEVNETMNPHCKEKGYLLGQLMAVLERIQTEALGNDINATLIDRYFAGASASPKSVFVGLLKNARYHAKKAKDEAGKKSAENNGKSGGRIYQLENLIDQICSHFEITLETLNKNPKVAYENGFPAYLKPEQQGMFVLGYHQMRKWLWMNKEEREAWNVEHSDAPRAYLWKSKKKPTRQVKSDMGESNDN